MLLVLNLLWLVLSGFWMFLAYMVIGVLWCSTVIGIPLGLANFKLIPIRSSLSARTSSQQARRSRLCQLGDLVGARENRRGTWLSKRIDERAMG